MSPLDARLVRGLVAAGAAAPSFLGALLGAGLGLVPIWWSLGLRAERES